jgi:hypothetical protein
MPQFWAAHPSRFNDEIAAADVLVTLLRSGSYLPTVPAEAAMPAFAQHGHQPSPCGRGATGLA